MEQEQENLIIKEEKIEQEENKTPKNKSTLMASAIISFSILILAGAILYSKDDSSPNARGYSPVLGQNTPVSDLENKVLPTQGISFPVRWGDLGIKLIAFGAIDSQKFESLYADQGGLDKNVKEMLEESNNEKLIINPQNSGQILNLLWALGLANKNPVLDNGPIQDPKYGGAGNFASTGGWTIAKGNAMEHYSAHKLIELTSDKQQLVQRVAKNIYRPCCSNSTYFPDCNHGMAMLGLLELLASQGFDESAMYQIALQVNSYWFPDTYLTIAKYMNQKGISWDKVDPKEMLGADFSSSSGYQKIVAETAKISEPDNSAPRNSGGCGV